MRLIILLLICSSIVFATQAIPQLASNNETMQCAEFFMGDESIPCSLPEGWDSIEECPEDYEMLDIQPEDPVCSSLPDESDTESNRSWIIIGILILIGLVIAWKLAKFAFKIAIIVAIIYAALWILRTYFF